MNKIPLFFLCMLCAIISNGANASQNSPNSELSLFKADREWKGIIEQPRTRPYEIHVTVTNNTVKVVYPKYRCGGSWRLVKTQEDGTRVFRENLVKGNHRCIDGGIVRLRSTSQGKLAYEWSHKYNKVTANGILTAKNRKKNQLSKVKVNHVPAGTWTGAYVCGRSKIGARLIVTSQNGGRLIARLELYKDPVSLRNKYGMIGYDIRFHQPQRKLKAINPYWIEKPGPGWTAVGFDGVLSSDLKTLTGQLKTRKCGRNREIELSKVESPKELNNRSSNNVSRQSPEKPSSNHRAQNHKLTERKQVREQNEVPNKRKKLETVKDTDKKNPEKSNKTANIKTVGKTADIKYEPINETSPLWSVFVDYKNSPNLPSHLSFDESEARILRCRRPNQISGFGCLANAQENFPRRKGSNFSEKVQEAYRFRVQQITALAGMDEQDSNLKIFKYCTNGRLQTTADKLEYVSGRLWACISNAVLPKGSIRNEDDLITRGKILSSIKSPDVLSRKKGGIPIIAIRLQK